MKKSILLIFFLASFLLIISLVNAISIVSVDSSKVTGINKHSLGTQLEKSISFTKFRTETNFRQFAKDANFTLIRFFEHRPQGGESACTYWNETTKSCKSWNWAIIDDTVSKIYETGAEPLIVLGFAKFDGSGLSTLPPGMQTNPTTLLPSTDQWAAYVAEWVRHFKDKGYPWDQVKYYEIVNEAFWYFGWTPDPTKLGYYMDLYNAAAREMRNVNPNVQLGSDESNKKNVLNKFISAGEPLNFISFHRYGTNSLSETDAQLLTNAETRYLQTTTSKYSPEDAVKAYKAAKGVELPVIMSEGNVNSAYNPNVDPRTRTIFGAVYTALSIRSFILKNISYSVYFSFGTNTKSIGMINTDNNQPWYPYYVHKMMGTNLAVGDLIVNSSSTTNDIRSLAWINNGKLNILLIHKSNGTNTVSLQGITGQLSYSKIDDTYPWDNPKEQIGTIDAGDTITLNGYTVMLLQSSSTISTTTTIPSPSGQVCKIKGLQLYPSPYLFSSTKTNQSLDVLNYAIPYTNYIYLDFWVDESGDVVTPKYNMENEYRSAVEKSRAKGYKIAVRIRHDPSPQSFMPSDLNKWFQTYTQSVAYWARFSESYDIELFGVGGEINRLDGNTYSDYWRNLINEVKKVYSGKLWYNVKNWDCNQTEKCDGRGYLSYETRLNAQWFKDLDYIGVSSYWSMCTSLDSSVEEMANNWYKYVGWGIGSDSGDDMHNQNIVKSLEALSKTHGKPIIIVTGLASARNSTFSACSKPWAWTWHYVDKEIQGKWYNASFIVFSKEPWVAGFLFDAAWFTDPTYNSNNKEFNVQGKPANETIAAWFESIEECPSGYACQADETCRSAVSTTSTTMPSDTESPRWGPTYGHTPQSPTVGQDVTISVDWYDNIDFNTIIIYENSSGPFQQHVCNLSTHQCSGKEIVRMIDSFSIILILSGSLAIIVIVLTKFKKFHKTILSFVSITLVIVLILLFIIPEIPRKISELLHLGIVPMAIGPTTFSHVIPGSQLQTSGIVVEYYSFANDSARNSNTTQPHKYFVIQAAPTTTNNLTSTSTITTTTSSSTTTVYHGGGDGGGRRVSGTTTTTIRSATTTTRKTGTTIAEENITTVGDTTTTTILEEKQKGIKLWYVIPTIAVIVILATIVFYLKMQKSLLKM